MIGKKWISLRKEHLDSKNAICKLMPYKCGLGDVSARLDGSTLRKKESRAEAGPFHTALANASPIATRTRRAKFGSEPFILSNSRSPSPQREHNAVSERFD